MNPLSTISKYQNYQSADIYQRQLSIQRISLSITGFQSFFRRLVSSARRFSASLMRAGSVSWEITSR